jgi:fumarylacetoacetate (FAA) hydrolase family protein
MTTITPYLQATTALPADADDAVLVGRVQLPGNGPVLAHVRPDGVHDLSRLAATCSELLELPDPAAAVRAHRGERLAATQDLLARSAFDARGDSSSYFLAPCDLQAIKAAGVTFVASMLERVIEEQARGDASRAESVRQAVVAVIGDNLGAIRPGSPEAARLKDVLIAQGMWSQYLEVGIGPDAEIFTKSQPMSAVGTGAEVGIHPGSAWNNPEPEVVLAVDIEGRSALLLGKAKDNNASCAIGPFIRLFDAGFGIADVRGCELSMRVEGPEGFVMHGASALSKISRDPLDLVSQAIGANHQYPDGFMLFLGTMFAPTQDRHGPGQGFTHVVGDIVTVATPRLGTLANRVNTSDRVPPWTYGTRALMRDLARRGLLG